MYDLPVFIWVLAVVAALGMPAMLGLALYRGATASGVARPRAVLAGAAGPGALIAWVTAAAPLASQEAFRFSGTAVVPRPSSWTSASCSTEPAPASADRGPLGGMR